MQICWKRIFWMERLASTKFKGLSMFSLYQKDHGGLQV